VTVVESPDVEIVNVPLAELAVYAYAAQPDGGVGTDAMNGPASSPALFVACAVKSVSAAGTVVTCVM
jgi:hypothetical protein